jgi:hypothetical protein
MPKLASVYTPLAPCLARIEKESAGSFVVVDGSDQLRAGRQVLLGGIDDGIVAEPSALATFAALPHLGDNAKRWDAEQKRWTYHRSRWVLVINSGLGILSDGETALLHRAMGL